MQRLHRLHCAPFARATRHLRSSVAVHSAKATTDAEIMALLVDKQLPHHKLEEETGDAE
jgi:hypothetical protein